MFKPADLDAAPWKARLSAGILFFFASCLVLTGFRLFFFLHFRSDGISFEDFWPALLMGARVDAKWLAILLLPAWVLAVASIPWRRARPAVRWLSGLALFLAVAAGLLNTGFYAFYATPVSSIVFGLFQDDTTAILKTIAADWPVGAYLLAGALCVAFPWGVLRLFGRGLLGAAAASRSTGSSTAFAK